MQIIAGDLHRDFSRDNYWTTVGLTSDTSKKETNILLCASYEYLSETLKTDDLTDEAVNSWVLTTVADIQKRGEELFSEPNHIEIRAITDEGRGNGFSFMHDKLAVAA